MSKLQIVWSGSNGSNPGDGVVAISSYEVLDSKLVLPGVLLDVIEALALDIGGPDTLDGGGSFGMGVEIQKVFRVIDGVTTRLRWASCSEAVGVVLLNALERGGSFELAEVALSEELVGVYGEIWRREAGAVSTDFLLTQVGELRSAVALIATGGAYFYPNGVVESLVGFPNSSCI